MDAVEHVAQSSGQVTQVPLIDTVELGHDVEGMQDPEWADIEEELQDRQVVEVLIQVEHEESHSKISLITLFKAGLMLATTYADMSRWSWQILLIRPPTTALLYTLPIFEQISFLTRLANEGIKARSA